MVEGTKFLVTMHSGVLTPDGRECHGIHGPVTPLTSLKVYGIGGMEDDSLFLGIGYVEDMVIVPVENVTGMSLCPGKPFPPGEQTPEADCTQIYVTDGIEPLEN